MSTFREKLPGIALGSLRPAAFFGLIGFVGRSNNAGADGPTFGPTTPLGQFIDAVSPGSSHEVHDWFFSASEVEVAATYAAVGYLVVFLGALAVAGFTSRSKKA